jgi:hypothetical protein
LHIECQHGSEQRIYEGKKLWSSICAGRKRGKYSRILHEFTTSDAGVFDQPRDHDCFLSSVPSPFLTRRAIFAATKDRLSPAAEEFWQCAKEAAALAARAKASDARR